MDARAIIALISIQTTESFSLAKQVYYDGANAGSYAVVNIGRKLMPIWEGTKVTGTSISGATISGKIRTTAGMFANKLSIVYNVGEFLPPCHIGGLPISMQQNITGCKSNIAICMHNSIRSVVHIMTNVSSKS